MEQLSPIYGMEPQQNMVLGCVSTPISSRPGPLNEQPLTWDRSANQNWQRTLDAAPRASLGGATGHQAASVMT